MTIDGKVTVNPDVVDAELDQYETALLHLGNRIYFTLNATGTRIWQELKRGHSLAEISVSLQREFGIDTERANSSVLRFAGELANHDLVVARNS
jgi:hypothetical protein